MAAMPAGSSVGFISGWATRSPRRSGWSGPMASAAPPCRPRPTRSAPSRAARPRSSCGPRRDDRAEPQRHGPPGGGDPARLRHAGCDARAPRSTLRRSPPTPPRAGRRGWAPASRHLCRSRAQRQHGLPDRLRSALRGGGADRRAGWRSGNPGRQRVLGHGRRCAAADATSSVPGPEPAEPAPRPIGAAGRHPGLGGHRSRQPGWRYRLEDVQPCRAERRTVLPGRCPARGGWRDRLGRERHRPADRCRRRAARDQRGGAAGRHGMGGMPDLVRRACGCCEACNQV